MSLQSPGFLVWKVELTGRDQLAAKSLIELQQTFLKTQDDEASWEEAVDIQHVGLQEDMIDIHGGHFPSQKTGL